MKEYSQTLDYLYGLEKFGMVFGLDNITWLLGAHRQPAGLPESGPHRRHQRERLRCLHVVGNAENGGLCDGHVHLPPPHLVHGAHRRQRRLHPGSGGRRADGVHQRADRPGRSARPLTFFDFTTALAFEYFKRKGVAIAVVEAGLGGRLDSTNVLRPLVTVITNVAFDHQEYLGNTIKEIAREKAGVVKEHVPVVTGAKGEPLEVIRAAAAKTALYALGENFTYKKKGEQLMWYRGIRMTYDDLSVALGGTTSFSTRPSPSARWSSSARPVSPSESTRSGRGLRRCSGRRGSSWSASPENPSSSSTAPTTPTGWPHSSRI